MKLIHLSAQCLALLAMIVLPGSEARAAATEFDDAVDCFFPGEIEPDLKSLRLELESLRSERVILARDYLIAYNDWLSATESETPEGKAEAARLWKRMGELEAQDKIKLTRIGELTKQIADALSGGHRIEDSAGAYSHSFSEQ